MYTVSFCRTLTEILISRVESLLNDSLLCAISDCSYLVLVAHGCNPWGIENDTAAKVFTHLSGHGLNSDHGAICFYVLLGESSFNVRPTKVF